LNNIICESDVFWTNKAMHDFGEDLSCSEDCKQKYRELIYTKLSAKGIKEYNFETLREAVINNKIEQVKLLLIPGELDLGHINILEGDYDVDDIDNYDDVYNKTVLMFASALGHTEIVKLLLETGKSHPEKTAYSSHCKCNMTALMFASAKGHEEIVKLLLATGESYPEYQNKSGDTALTFSKNIKIDKILLDYCKSLAFSTDKNGNTPLIASYGNTERVKLLLASGKSRPGHTNKFKATALMIASRPGYDKIVKLLLATGESHPEYQNHLGNTALMIASYEGHDKIVKLLLKKGKSHPEYQDKDGKNALMLASENGHDEVVELLEKHTKK
jgi:serine/threonine-protein phosphatase 6 regulatory ankyrin repeat subunit B